MTLDDRDALRAQIARLEQELSASRQEIARLQRETRASEVAEAPAINEYEDTLRRLVQKIAMILQAEKCAIMILDKDTGHLIGSAPAFGIGDHDIKLLRVKITEGIAGEVFRTERPAIFHDAVSDPRTVKENVAVLHIRNGVMVPLIVEKRDEEGRVLDHLAIGILCVFNKRYSGEFIEEDVRLLERLARNAASVIANARMFQEIVEEKEKLLHTIESLYAGLILVSGTGKVMQMNARARQIFNVAADPVGKEYQKVLKHDRALEILARMLEPDEQTDKTADDDEDTRAAEEINVTEPETDEVRVFQMHSALVRGEDSHLIGTAVILNDITEIRNLERMKTEFVAIAAHELRTPMTPIKGFISMLAEDEFDSFSFEERKEYYQIINQNVDRLGRLINDLLSVSRIETGTPIKLFWEEVDLTELAESVFEVQRGMTNTEKHPLALDSQPEHIWATVGRDQLDQILQNLVSNAIKYSPEGGEVRLILREEPETKAILCGVRDQGTGIPESALPKLFKRYQRIHNPKTASVKGTGIGLFLVKSLIEAHHGNIWVESKMGKGTTFWFRVPKAPPEDDDPDTK